MSILHILTQFTTKSLANLYPGNFSPVISRLTGTKPEFEGDYTIVLFSLVKKLKLSPDALGEALGKKLVEQHPEIFNSYNLIKGFLNLSINDHFWTNDL